MFTGMIDAQVNRTTVQSRSVTGDPRIDMRSRPTTNRIHTELNRNNGSNSANKIAAPCPGPTNVPYSENFDGVTAPSVPDCITVENVNGGNTWRTVDSPTDFPVSFPNLMRLDFEPDGITSADDWFFTRGLNLTGGTSYRLTFMYRNSDGTLYTEKLEVKYGSAANAASMTSGTLFSNTSINSNFWAVGGTDFTPATTGVYYIGFHGFSDANQAYLALDDIQVDATPACPSPIAVTMTNITSSSGTVNFTPAGPNYIVEYGQTGFTPGLDGNAGIGGTVVNITSAQVPYTITGLASFQSYDVYVRQVCSGPVYGSNSSVTTFVTTLVNDDAPGAISISVNASCSGNSYTNVGATQSSGEPFASCTGTAGYHTVWYKFIAPAGGAVKISNDFVGSGLTDSRMAVFSATNVNDYSTFTILGCDDDNGVAVTANSIIYLTGLTPSNTYYIQVDGNNSSTPQGSFCLEVSTLTSSMLAGTASCGSSQGFANLNSTYTGWISLVDNSGNLIANMKQTAGTATSVSANINVNTGPIRTDIVSGEKYLDRNYMVSAAGITSAVVQLFLLDTELSTLAAHDPSATLSNLKITLQTGAICQGDFNAANGTNSELIQTGNGSSNGVSWINTNTSSLSNFYLHSTKTFLIVKAFLQGAYNASLGRHKDVTPTWAAVLNANALNQPYNTAAFGNYNGGESVSAGFFTSNAGNALDILDWVLLEIKNSSNVLVARRAALLREDGKIVDINGDTLVTFNGLSSGNYYVTIRHRNHLGISGENLLAVSSKTLGVTLPTSTYNFDFTTASDAAIFGTSLAFKVVSGKNVMISGNANSNTTVRYAGPGNDPASILLFLGSSTGGIVNNVYSPNDVNMDGTVRYAGPGNDPGFLLNNALGGSTGLILTEQKR
jgi:hypothetical protein